MFTSNLTKLNSVPIIAYNSNVHFARNVPFSLTWSHIVNREIDLVNREVDLVNHEVDKLF